MSITKLINWTTFSGLLLATAFTSTSVFANTLPGITDDSFPQFRSNVTIKQVRVKGQRTNTWSISGNAGSFFTGIQDFDEYKIKGGGKFAATVNWSDAGSGEGTFLNGTVSINGKINNQSILMTANLDGYQWDGDLGENGSWLGFNTINISCNDNLNALIGGGGCTDNESLLINLKNGWDGLELALPNKGLGGTAITSVPLPAAAWLFISGLGLIGVTTRRKQKTVV